MATVDSTKRGGGDRPFLRLSEAAEILGISTRQAYRWAKRGRIPTVELGGDRGRFVPRDALAAFLAAEAEAALTNLVPDGHRAADEARTNDGAGAVTKQDASPGKEYL